MYWLRNILFRFIIQVITGTGHEEQNSKKRETNI